jgi:hypothetical protein
VAPRFRDQEAAAHGLVDGLHRSVDPADGSPRAAGGERSQDGGGVDEPDGVSARTPP